MWPHLLAHLFTRHLPYVPGLFHLSPGSPWLSASPAEQSSYTTQPCTLLLSPNRSSCPRTESEASALGPSSALSPPKEAQRPTCEADTVIRAPVHPLLLRRGLTPAALYTHQVHVWTRPRAAPLKAMSSESTPSGLCDLGQVPAPSGLLIAWVQRGVGQAIIEHSSS